MRPLGRILIAALLLLVGPAAAEEIQVVKSGKYYGMVEVYQVGDDLYLSAKTAASIYGGQRHWFAVRKRVQLSLRGKIVRFHRNSAEANVDGQRVTLPRPVLFRANRAMIPIEFFSSEAFAGIAGVDTRFKKDTRLLLVDARSSVGPLRWFSYSDHTRVVLELGVNLRYTTSRRGLRGFDLAVPNGTIDWSEKIDVGDGVVEFIHLFQESKQARLSIKLMDGAENVQTREFKDPRRVVIDIARSKTQAPAARDRRIAMEAPAPPKRRSRAAGKKPKSPFKGSLGGAAAAAKAPGAVRAARKASPSPPPLTPRSGKFRIVIDPGHGGRDGGAVGRRGAVEKEINLAASLELAKLLKQEGVFQVRLTRSTDKFIKLRERSKFANTHHADLFVSLHANANASRRLSGYEIYVLSEKASDPEAERLAEFENSVLALEGEEVFGDAAAAVLYAMAKTEFINEAAELAGLMARSLAKRVDLPNRGVKQADFYVLRGTNMPAVLVEMGYLTNARDEAKLQSKKYRRKIVEGLCAGVVDYAKRKGLKPEKKR